MNGSSMLHGIWNIGKKVVVTGMVASSAPFLIPPLAVLTTVGIVFTIPFGVAVGSYACAAKIMELLFSQKQLPLEEDHKGYVRCMVQKFENIVDENKAWEYKLDDFDSEIAGMDEIDDHAAIVNDQIHLQGSGNLDMIENVDVGALESITNDKSHELAVEFAEILSCREQPVGGAEIVEVDDVEVAGKMTEDEHLLNKNTILLQDEPRLAFNETGSSELSAHLQYEQGITLLAPCLAESIVITEGGLVIDNNMLEEVDRGIEDEQTMTDKSLVEAIACDFATSEALTNANDQLSVMDEIHEYDIENVADTYAQQMREECIHGALVSDSPVSTLTVEVSSEKVLLSPGSTENHEHELSSSTYSASSQMVSIGRDSLEYSSEHGGAVGQALSTEITDEKPGIQDHSTYFQEDQCAEEKIWEQIHGMRAIIGCTDKLCASYTEELNALFLFTGVEPPSPGSTSDLMGVNNKLQILKSVVGIM